MTSAKWRVLRALSVLAPGLVIFFIWFPGILHFRVPHISVTDAMVESGRRAPANEVLAELGRVRFFVDAPQDQNELIVNAENLLTGSLDQSTKITIPFAPEDLEKGQWQLFLAGFGVPRVLLSAYVASGREIFFDTAKKIILGWAAYENKAWRPRGLLWNDHAVAERMLVLADFWRLYRQRSDYRLDEARVVLQLAARTSWLLAAPSHFKFSTNHGVMQNLALWHFSLAFPSLPSAQEYQKLALSRMRYQMSFYINEEGVVLEHSSNYHVFGLKLLAYAMRYMTLANLPVPGEWIRKYNGAQTFYSDLRLSNGYLPVFGDTGTYSHPMGPLVTKIDLQGRASALAPAKNWAPRNAHSLYPVAGYSVWWDGLDAWPHVEKLAQLVVAWSYFPGHAHKHADEMSLSLWARGQRWLTNIGARSSGKERSEALSWNGSNAPHLANEDYDSSRSTKLRFFGWSGRLAFLDLERTGPGGYIARRQIIWKKPNLWIALDHIRGKEGHRGRTIWRADESVKWSKGKVPWSFHLRGKDTESILTGLFVASAGAEITPPSSGGNKGFGDSQFVVVQQPAGNSCLAAIWSLAQNQASRDFMDGDRSIECEHAGTWKLSFPTDSGNTTVRRSGQVVEFFYADRNGSRQSESVVLQKANDTSEEYQQIRNGYAQAAAKYPLVNQTMAYRTKAIKLLVILFLLQEIFFLLCRRIYPPGYRNLRTLSAIAWIVVGTLLCTQFERVVEMFSGLNLPI